MSTRATLTPLREYIYFLLEQENAKLRNPLPYLRDANTPGVGHLRGMTAERGKLRAEIVELSVER